MLGADCRPNLELGRIGCRAAAGQKHLCPRDPKGEDHRVGGRLPQPEPDLVVEGLDLAGFHDVRVVAETVEELGPVGLRIDRLEFVGAR